MPSTTWADELRSVAYVSPQLLTMTGYSTRDWLAEPAMWADRLHPEDREHVLRRYRDACELRSRFVCEYRLLDREGSVVWWRDEGRQLAKEVDVVRVADITGDNIIDRELALIKVRATSATRSEIIEIVDIFRASIVDVASDSVTIEVTGDEDKVNSLFNLLRGFGIKEVARTGRIAMARGERAPLPVEEKPFKTRAKGQKT